MKMSFAEEESRSLNDTHFRESTTKKLGVMLRVRQVGSSSKSLGILSTRPHANDPATQLLSENDSIGVGGGPSSTPQSFLLPSKRRNWSTLSRPGAPVINVVGTPTPRSFVANR